MANAINDQLLYSCHLEKDKWKKEEEHFVFISEKWDDQHLSIIDSHSCRVSLNGRASLLWRKYTDIAFLRAYIYFFLPREICPVIHLYAQKLKFFLGVLDLLLMFCQVRDCNLYLNWFAHCEDIPWKRTGICQGIIPLELFLFVVLEMLWAIAFMVPLPCQFFCFNSRLPASPTFMNITIEG